MVPVMRMQERNRALKPILGPRPRRMQLQVFDKTTLEIKVAKALQRQRVQTVVPRPVTRHPIMLQVPSRVAPKR